MKIGFNIGSSLQFTTIRLKLVTVCNVPCSSVSLYSEQSLVCIRVILSAPGSAAWKSVCDFQTVEHQTWPPGCWRGMQDQFSRSGSLLPGPLPHALAHCISVSDYTHSVMLIRLHLAVTEQRLNCHFTWSSYSGVGVSGGGRNWCLERKMEAFVTLTHTTGILGLPWRAS